MIDSLLSLLDVPALRTVVPGTALLGLTAGAVGCFAVLRRQSLQGDVVSHAALPGVAIAFLLGGRSPVLLIVGGAVAGWVALVMVGVIGRRSRVPTDAALGGTLAVFFGFGLALMRHIQVNVPDAAQHPLDRYLFGQAATLRGHDIWTIAGLGIAALSILALAWKELKLLSFDPDYAASIGLPVRGFDLLLTTVTVVAVVIGPRPWRCLDDRATRCAAAWHGPIASGSWSFWPRLRAPRDRTVLAPSRRNEGGPTGPTIVLIATGS